MISASQAVTNGTTKNATTISKTLNQAESTSINLNALIGPTIPIKPNPAALSFHEYLLMLIPNLIQWLSLILVT